MRFCKICGKEFLPKTSKQKCCSTECSKENRHRQQLSSAKKFYKNNRQYCLECHHDYYLAHKEKISAYKKEWYQRRKVEKANENH